MGNVRTPRPVYFKHGVIEFFVENKIVYYRTILWSEDGLTQFVLESAKYQGNSDELVKKALQSFSNVDRPNPARAFRVTPQRVFAAFRPFFGATN